MVENVQETKDNVHGVGLSFDGTNGLLLCSHLHLQ